MMKRMEKKREFFGLPIMFWGLWVTLLILWMGRFVTSFLSMYLVSDMHVSAGVAGTIVSMYGFGGIFGCLYGGALSDRFGRPAMIVIGNLGSAVMLVLLAFIGNPWIMAIALLIYGAISSMPTPAVAAYVSDVVPFRKQKRAYSLQTWAANFGFAIGPIIANQLVKISYSLMFYAEAAVLVFATLLMIVFFKEAGIGGRAAKSSVKQVVEQPAEAAESQRSQQFSIWRSYRRACTDKALMSMVVLMFLYTLAYYQIVSGLPISMTQIGLGTDEWMGRFVTSFLSMYLVSDMHVSAGVAGTIVSMYGFGGIFGCLYGGALSDRFGRPAMIVIGNLGSAVMLVLLACIGNPWIMAITLLIYGAISSMPTPAVAAYVSDVVPFRKQKRAYSLQTWAANFGFAIGPIIANQLVKISYSLMFYAEAAVLVFATLLMMAFFKEAGLGVHGVGRSVKRSVEQPVERSDTAQTAQSQQSKFSIWRSYRRACTDKALMSMVVLMFLYTLAYYQIVSGLPISMTQIGLGTDEYSSLLTINGGILCLLQIPAIALFQRMSNTRVLVLGMSITAVGYAFQIGADSWVTFAIATVLWTLGELGAFPIAATTVANIAPKDVRGTYQGLYNLVWSLSNAFSPLVGGWILNAFGSHVLWTCCTVMFVIVAIGFYVTRGPRERAAARNLAMEEL